MRSPLWLSAYPGILSHSKPLLPLVSSGIVLHERKESDTLHLCPVLKIQPGEVSFVHTESEARAFGSYHFIVITLDKAVDCGCRTSRLEFSSLSVLWLCTQFQYWGTHSSWYQMFLMYETQTGTRRPHFVHRSTDLCCVTLSSGF